MRTKTWKDCRIVQVSSAHFWCSGQVSGYGANWRQQGNAIFNSKRLPSIDVQHSNAASVMATFPSLQYWTEFVSLSTKCQFYGFTNDDLDVVLTLLYVYSIYKQHMFLSFNHIVIVVCHTVVPIVEVQFKWDVFSICFCNWYL